MFYRQPNIEYTVPYQYIFHDKMFIKSHHLLNFISKNTTEDFRILFICTRVSPLFNNKVIACSF